jgi:hypothetical protein
VIDSAAFAELTFQTSGPTVRGSPAARVWGEHLRSKTDYNARLAADLHARSPVGRNRCWADFAHICKTTAQFQAINAHQASHTIFRTSKL